MIYRYKQNYVEMISNILPEYIIDLIFGLVFKNHKKNLKIKVYSSLNLELLKKQTILINKYFLTKLEKSTVLPFSINCIDYVTQLENIVTKELSNNDSIIIQYDKIFESLTGIYSSTPNIIVFKPLNVNDITISLVLEVFLNICIFIRDNLLKKCYIINKNLSLDMIEINKYYEKYYLNFYIE
jgi:hypothetical protein|tara:strand:+ start:1432 stop:1980 length:549 start_codon:yes stop_codon:yes gene_type:complete